MRRGAIAGIWVAGALGAACSTPVGANDVTVQATYPDDYAFAADLALAEVYWVDDWTSGGGITVGRAGGPAASLRALARAASLCPGHVTVVPRTDTTEVCSGQLGAGVRPARTGAIVTFVACRLDQGGTLAGTFDVSATIVASDAGCGPATMVTVQYRATFTNFDYTAPDNTMVAIASLVDTGSYVRAPGAGPTSLAVTTAGSMQRLDKSSTTISDHDLNGSRSHSFVVSAGSVSDIVEGRLIVQDRDAGNVATVDGSGVTLVAGCCRPTAGKIVVGGTGRTPASWTYGPACGAVAVNGQPAGLPMCP